MIREVSSAASRPPGRSCIAVLASLLLFVVHPATAQEEASTSVTAWEITDDLTLSFPGSLRLGASGVEAVAVELADPSLADEVDEELAGHLRLRLKPRLQLRGLSLGPWSSLTIDADAEWTSSWTSLEGAAVLRHDPVVQRQGLDEAPRLNVARLALDGEQWSVQAGLIRSHWGTGMVANRGEDPRPGDRGSGLGIVDRGDRVARAQLTWKLTGEAESSAAPAPMMGVGIGADLVIDDDLASYADGDRAVQFLTAVQGRYGATGGGLYWVHREQDHHEGGHTRLDVVDLVLYQHLAHGWIDAWVEAEAALALGETTSVTSVSAPGPMTIAGFGGLLRFGLAVGPVRAILETGTASGDDNPYDGELRQFSFDRSYRVGLLLFREGLRKVSAVSAFNVADPTYRGAPPQGFDGLATGGSVRGASYVNPRLEIRVLQPLTLHLGYVHAESEEDYTDPFQTGLAGGESRGPRGIPGQRDLGHELDAGLVLRLDTESVDLGLRAEFAWWRPGSVFFDEQGVAPDDVLGGSLTLEGTW